MSRSVLVVGAHPDDPDIRAGGYACVHAAAGGEVRFLSLTDGRAGHHELSGDELVRRRREEAAAAAAVAGIEYRILDIPDGRLRPSLENRAEVIRQVREYDPDLVLTHRPDDYHPDHRYTAQLVRDAAYMVAVPNVLPAVPALESNPVFGYVYDAFDRPAPFDPDVFVPVDEAALERKYDMLDRHDSQLYEWLPHAEGLADAVPEGAAARREWLETDPLPMLRRMRAAADRYRDRLIDRFGPERGREIDYVEPFEISEYGSELTADLERELFQPG